MSVLRDMAQQTQIVGDPNPYMDRQAALELDLFEREPQAQAARSKGLHRTKSESRVEVEGNQSETLHTIQLEL